MKLNLPPNYLEKEMVCCQTHAARSRTVEFNIDIEGIFLQEEKISQGHDAIQDSRVYNFLGPTTATAATFPFP